MKDTVGFILVAICFVVASVFISVGFCNMLFNLEIDYDRYAVVDQMAKLPDMKESVAKAMEDGKITEWEYQELAKKHSNAYKQSIKEKAEK